MTNDDRYSRCKALAAVTDTVRNLIQKGVTQAISRRICLAVNDPIIGEVQGELLRSQGHHVRILDLSTISAEEIVRFSPDLVVVDTYPNQDDPRRISDELLANLPIFGVQVIVMSTVVTEDEKDLDNAGEKYITSHSRRET